MSFRIRKHFCELHEVALLAQVALKPDGVDNAQTGMKQSVCLARWGESIVALHALTPEGVYITSVVEAAPWHSHAATLKRRGERIQLPRGQVTPMTVYEALEVAGFDTNEVKEALPERKVVPLSAFGRLGGSQVQPAIRRADVDGGSVNHVAEEPLVKAAPQPADPVVTPEAFAEMQKSITALTAALNNKDETKP